MVSQCDGIRWLDVNDLIDINKIVSSITPNEQVGVMKPNNLKSAQNRPNQYRYYEQTEDIYKLAAMVFIAFVQAHAFHNANKRTAYVASVVFCRINGYDFNPPIETAIQMALDVEAKRNNADNPDYLSSWFEAFSIPLSENYDYECLNESDFITILR